jgi:tetratricopeptide (TPR) repeat protein
MGAVTPTDAFSEAVRLHQAGAWAEAERQYRSALQLRPDHAAAHNNLAHVLMAQGRLGEAENHCREALRLEPNQGRVHLSLGHVLRKRQQPQEALRCYREAVRREPELVEAQQNLANVLAEQGEFEEAVHWYQEVLCRRPDLAEIHYNLGWIRASQGRLPEAIASYQQAVRCKPDYAEAYNNMGVALLNSGLAEEACACYRQALRYAPESAELHNNLGNALKEQAQVEEAVPCYERALRLRPQYAHACNNLGDAHLDLGDIDRAFSYYKEGLRLKPEYAQALYNLSRLVVQGYEPAADGLAGRMEALLAAGRQTPSDTSLLHFGLGDLLHRQGRTDEAFAHYRDANAVRLRMERKAGTAFDPANHARRIERWIAFFDKEFFAQARNLGLDTEVPVFILGMPRSGTSLVEQILASHPAVHGAGELSEIGRLVLSLSRLPGPQGASAPGSGPYPECLAELSTEGARALAAPYLQGLRQRSSTAARITDKMPENYLHLGLIALLWPRARIIHCRRHPLDVCLSCYFQNFKQLNFTLDLRDLGLYHRGYERLLAHWRALLPLRVCEVVYEELVADQEAVSRRLLAFCGLDWDDHCLEFQKNKRAVQTASKLQVREPIYTRAVGRWRRYEKYLGELKEVL